MRINPTTQSQPQVISGSKPLAPSISFQSKLNAGQKTAVSDLKQDLKQVSLDLKAGKITDEQASRQFVNLVIEKRSELGLTPAGMTKIQNAVGELVSGDPTLVSKIQNELKKI